jgi:Lrp/AsnC family transcriptional regulator, regulator for asnA, asnC and gidA
MRELTEIDIKILQEMLQDGRKNFTAMAKDFKTSKDIIWKHYKELKKTGIIVGATTQSDPRKLGSSGLATISISLETQNMAETFDRLKNTSKFNFFRYYNTSNTLSIITALKNLGDLQHAKEVISRENKINDISTNLWLEVRNIPENIFSTQPLDAKKVPVRPLANSEETGELKLDETDHQIIDRLTKNGRLSFSKIAEELGLSTNTIVRRYEKLLKSKIIKVTIQFNPIELGFQAMLDLNLSVSNQSEINAIADRLSRIVGVSYIVKVGGNFDLMVVALVKDCKDIIKISDEVFKIPNIKKIDGKLRQIPSMWPTNGQYITTF